MTANLAFDLRLRNGDFELAVAGQVPLAGVTALFGASGAGKSTLLRLLAGLTRATGRVQFGREVWQHPDGAWVPAHARGVGYMAQDAALFSHLDVAANLRYAARRAPGADATRELVEAFDLQALLHRSPEALSGGERKRVVLARTLLSGPRLLLLDEPLTGLDRSRRADILPYLESLTDRFAVPVIYVSHDVDEVARLAERTLLLEAGRLRLSGPTVQVLQQLDVDPIAGAFEASRLLIGVVSRPRTEFDLLDVVLDDRSLSLPAAGNLAVGDPVRLRVLARDVALATERPQGLSIRNVLPGTIVGIEAGDGPFAMVDIQLREQTLAARVTRASVAELALARGMAVYALVKSATFERG